MNNCAGFYLQQKSTLKNSPDTPWEGPGVCDSDAVEKSVEKSVLKVEERIVLPSSTTSSIVVVAGSGSSSSTTSIVVSWLLLLVVHAARRTLAEDMRHGTMNKQLDSPGRLYTEDI